MCRINYSKWDTIEIQHLKIINNISGRDAKTIYKRGSKLRSFCCCQNRRNNQARILSFEINPRSRSGIYQLCEVYMYIHIGQLVAACKQYQHTLR